MTMKKNNPGCCTCGSVSCTCAATECWEPYETDTDADVPHPLTCLCLDVDDCPIPLTDLSIDVVGDGTPFNDDISCDTVACDWDGTFVISCGTFEDPWQKYTYICDGVYGGVVKFYYRHTITFSYTAVGVFIKTTTNRATFNLIIELRSVVVAFPFLGTQPTTGTWLNEAADGTVVNGSGPSYVRHVFTGTFRDFKRNAIDETNCPTDPCNPVGELVELNCVLTKSVTHDTQGQGCYPDPDNMVITPSWP